MPGQIMTAWTGTWGLKLGFLNFFIFYFLFIYFFFDNLVYNLCEADTRFRGQRGNYAFPQIFTVGDAS